MKNWSTQNKFLFTVAIALTIGSIFTVIAWSIQAPSQTTSSEINPALCPTMTDNLSKSNSLRFHPIKVVVEPWRGEHHVYSIFALPLQYKEIYYRSQLLVKDTDTPWEVTPTDGLRYGAITPDDHFLVIGFFPTRLTLWYWVSGRFGDLQQPCNWTLHLFPKKS
ncbi:hypothetical protein [Pseudanabaena minima]|uniref:hypothetical protein n=1 Tax=Pseudanabaena minima TaxID=890415 RepID=UPI003DA9A407